MRVLVAAVVGAFLCGAGSASQSRINGELATELGDGYVAAVISFGSGMLILLVAIAVAPTGRRGLTLVLGEVRGGRMPWWYLAGGAGGAFFVLTQGLTAALLGIAVFTVAIVAGQTIAGFIIDRRGLGTMRPRAITPPRAVGGILMLVAVGVVVSGQIRESFPWWVVVLPMLAGFATGWQQAVNGQVRVASGSPIAATFINFVVGTTLLLIAMLVHAASAGWPTGLPANPVLYLGGVIGVLFIAVGAIVTPVIGVLLMGFGLVAGQLTTSLVLDLVAPVAAHPISWLTVAGTGLALIAVTIAAIPRGSSGAARS
jgi:transporter family-2 protein